MTFENRRLLIPNSILSEDRILNSTIRDESTCEFIEYELSLGIDVELAMRLLQHQAMLHPDRIPPPVVNSMENQEDAITVRLTKIHEGTITLRAYVWAKDPVLARRLHYDLNRAMHTEFPKHGISFAMPVRRIYTEDPPLPQAAPDGQIAQ